MPRKIRIISLNYNANALFGICSGLERKNFEVLVLVHLEDFIESVRIFNPDIILYDHIIPVGKSLSIFSNIKSYEKTKHTKILFASEFELNPEPKSIDALLKKPYTIGSIIRKVETLLKL